MKKLLYSAIILSLVFATSCGKDKNSDDKKLVSKITYVDQGYEPYTQSFKYDSKNRLIEDFWQSQWGWSKVKFIYEGNNNFPLKWEGENVDMEDGEIVWENTWEREITVSGNFVLLGYGDTLVINSNGQMIEFREGDYYKSFFHYNSNGNLISNVSNNNKDTLSIEYSNHKAIFRHMNIASWFVFLNFDYMFPGEGYMPSKFTRNYVSGNASMTYTSKDGYVRTITYTDTFDWDKAPAIKNNRPNRVRKPAKNSKGESSLTIEYIDAK
jgi:hypothetical protein